MQQNEIKVRVLTPEPGHMLTQSAEVSDADRFYSDSVYLAAGDSPENWREATAAEAEAHAARMAYLPPERLSTDKGTSN